MTYNAADEKQVKRRQQKAKDVNDQQRADLGELIKLPAFRRYIWRVINEYCQVMQSPFSTNGSAMTLNVGMQEVGKRLWTEIEGVEPLAIPKMMTEFYESREQA